MSGSPHLDDDDLRFELRPEPKDEPAGLSLDDLLRRMLGDDATFRPGQREAIVAVLADGARVLVVQKTGWGKSVVYWLATRVRRDLGHGPTMIVSPLLSLMRDQIRAAARLGLRCATVNSQNRDAWREVLAALERDEVDVLLISPERLANDEFVREYLPAIQGTLGLFVVDEVHCISDWGHDFRPDYRRISRIIAALPPSVPILGTTATANSRVREDVAAQLGPTTRRVEGALRRESLRLATLELPDQASRLAWLTRFIPQMPGSGIVYCLTVADTERVASWLTRSGIDARPYHGRLDAQEREQLEQALIANEVKAIVATVALGMGFDKPDLTFVIHYQRPGSVISYYQQVGRAGRAVRDADGILLSGHEDDEIQEYFIRIAFPPADDMAAVLRALEAVPAATTVNLERMVNLRRGRIEAILKLLVVDGAVARDGGRYFRTASAWEPDVERIERVTRLRHDELQQMRDYVQHDGCLMRFLTDALDDPAGQECGRCMNCRGVPPPTTVDDATVQRAIDFLRRSHRPISPRLRWVTDAVAGLSGPISRPNEEGVALSIYGDAGWGAMVADDKYRAVAFRTGLLEAAVRLIESTWHPVSQDGWWVTAVPSRQRASMVGDAAQAIAARLGLPYREVLAKTVSAAPPKDMQNSAMQLANAWRTLEVVGDVLPGSVVLIDDIVDSRWTMSVAGHLLVNHGAGPVYPFAFAEASAGDAG